MQNLAEIREAKKKLRQEALARRMALSDDEWSERSTHIQSCFLDLFEGSTFDTVHLYTAMLLRNEIDTETLALRLLDAGKRVAVPVMSFADRSLSHFLVTRKTLWKTNRWGVSEPVDGEPVSAEDLELIVVPMVAADAACNRLGYGKGYYDTFLKETPALKVGLCFECCMVDRVPCEPHDVRLHHVITEDRFLSGAESGNR
ncbi:5-formyltetrahydrofolate cyclo-ligase [Cyclonatronum proteinivorum]|uniref:5-formyltetrahydrofolate cyclo-ligase n=1 Tax=Cyclonatronum proteinivorum TaxID=1457365 RepID=A0A345UMX8_9BACT|nr:5-formyltetrahydrofolate cyclo-ligase [Cyclonatronum proteinivorum]AXJ01830.1 5-formyltetrahydrofolate cyclo-ligase [Cyclonatronum proteinivorum]